MPVYEYFCLDCRKTFDILRTMRQADEPLRCMLCQSERTRRALSLFAAQSSSADGGTTALGGGCACGGACACGHH